MFKYVFLDKSNFEENKKRNLLYKNTKSNRKINK